jgi:hypothetical protein
LISVLLVTTIAGAAVLELVATSVDGMENGHLVVDLEAFGSDQRFAKFDTGLR